MTDLRLITREMLGLPQPPLINISPELTQSLLTVIVAVIFMSLIISMIYMANKRREEKGVYYY